MKRLIVLVGSWWVAMVVATGAQVRPVSRAASGGVPAAVHAAADPALSAPFFDGSVMQEIRLDMNSRDWQTLTRELPLQRILPGGFSLG